MNHNAPIAANKSTEELAIWLDGLLQGDRVYHTDYQTFTESANRLRKQSIRITELEAQLADAKQAARWESDPASQALADLEPYRKDAERYHWLRSRDLDTVHVGGVFAGEVPQNNVLNGADLDNAIDAAIQPKDVEIAKEGV